MGRRRSSGGLCGKSDFLRCVEEMHRQVQRAQIGLRLDCPDALALKRLAAELREAYRAIDGVEVVPWALDTTTYRHPRPWDRPT